MKKTTLYNLIFIFFSLYKYVDVSTDLYVIFKIFRMGFDSIYADSA